MEDNNSFKVVMGIFFYFLYLIVSNSIDSNIVRERSERDHHEWRVRHGFDEAPD
jgi:hypothetical protein